MSTSSSANPLPAAYFATTHWSVVLLAARDDAAGAKQAMASLCQAYWYPVYAFVRRQGESPHDAEDVTQEFFYRLIEKNFLKEVAREKGRFRSFLLAAMKHFLSNERDKARALKRGGGKQIISIDVRTAETRYAREIPDPQSPEKLFERRWALELLERVLMRLRQEYVSSGKEALFEAAKECLTTGRTAVPYVELARTLHMTESALKVAVHRMRQRYRELLREEIAQTVATPNDVESELHYLMKVLSE